MNVERLLVYLIVYVVPLKNKQAVLVVIWLVSERVYIYEYEFNIAL